LPGLQEAAARRFEEGLKGVLPKQRANGVTEQNVGKIAHLRSFGL